MQRRVYAFSYDVMQLAEGGSSLEFAPHNLQNHESKQSSVTSLSWVVYYTNKQLANIIRRKLLFSALVPRFHALAHLVFCLLTHTPWH